MTHFFQRTDLDRYVEEPGGAGQVYQEVRAALEGRPMTMVRVDENNTTIVSVAVPIRVFGVFWVF